MMQGLALGGELPASITFVSEHVASNRRGFALSILFLGINSGLLLGSFVTALLTLLCTPETLLAYGWRIPFLLGGFFGIASMFLRHYLRETAAFTALGKQDIVRVPLFTLIRHSSYNIITGMLLVALGSITVFLYLFWPQYLHQYMDYDFTTLMLINTASMVLLNITIPLGGLLSDKIGYRFSHLMNCAFIIIFTTPLFILFNLQSLTWVIISYVLFSILFGLFLLLT